MRKTLLALSGAGLFAIGLAAGAATATPGSAPTAGAAVGEAAGTTAAKGAEAAMKASANRLTEGTWQVGAEAKPGTYTTTADDHCYWARISNFDGDLNSIIANDNLAPGSRGRITVKKTDKGLELKGSCVWVRADG